MRIDADDLEFDENDLARDADGKEFTGEAVTLYPDGSISSLQEFLSGIPHGKEQEFFANGTLEFDGLWNNGRPVNPHRRWHENGQLAEQREYGPIGLARITRWDENGQLVSVEE
jgi:antitoxin component YwqK of YwqJK toxin-antitoxin module